MDILNFSFHHNTFEECLVFPQNDPLDCKSFEHCILGIDLDCIAIKNHFEIRYEETNDITELSLKTDLRCARRESATSSAYRINIISI